MVMVESSEISLTSLTSSDTVFLATSSRSGGDWTLVCWVWTVGGGRGGVGGDCSGDVLADSGIAEAGQCSLDWDSSVTNRGVESGV